MKKSSLVLLLFFATLVVNGQSRFYTKNGKVSFNATSSLEKIEATTEKATSILDMSTGALEFSVLMKAFNFEKALMQEHFNENYMESDKYPKGVFKGTIVNLSTLDLKKDGTFPVKIKGTLTMHGETKDVLADGSLTIKEGALVAGKSDFKVVLEDYKIEIPSLVKDKIAREVKISVDANYTLLKSS